MQEVLLIFMLAKTIWKRKNNVAITSLIYRSKPRIQNPNCHKRQPRAVSGNKLEAPIGRWRVNKYHVTRMNEWMTDSLGPCGFTSASRLHLLKKKWDVQPGPDWESSVLSPIRPLLRG